MTVILDSLLIRFWKLITFAHIANLVMSITTVCSSRCRLPMSGCCFFHAVDAWCTTFLASDSWKNRESYLLLLPCRICCHEESDQMDVHWVTRVSQEMSTLRYLQAMSFQTTRPQHCFSWIFWEYARWWRQCGRVGRYLQSCEGSPMFYQMSNRAFCYKNSYYLTNAGSEWQARQDAFCGNFSTAN